MELSQAEEVVEHLGLDDLGRLRHPDPVGEAGELDRGRHRDEVAIALGERRIDRDEAVLGHVDLDGDAAGGIVGQAVGRADQDHPGIELEQSTAGDLGGQAPDEADVPGPEQALIGRPRARRR